MLVDGPVIAVQLLFDNLRNVSVPSITQIVVDPADLEDSFEPTWTFRSLGTTPKLTDAHIVVVPVDLFIPMLRTRRFSIRRETP